MLYYYFSSYENQLTSLSFESYWRWCEHWISSNEHSQYTSRIPFCWGKKDGLRFNNISFRINWNECSSYFLSIKLPYPKSIRSIWLPLIIRWLFIRIFRCIRYDLNRIFTKLLCNQGWDWSKIHFFFRLQRIDWNLRQICRNWIRDTFLILQEWSFSQRYWVI